MKAALVIGGAGALSTATGLFGSAAGDSIDGDVSIADRNNRQHAWDAYERYDEDKETSLPPESQLLLNMDYEGSGTPSAEHRQTVEEALHKLEKAFGWGHEGLLFTIGYSPAYFERFSEDGDIYPLPRGLDPNSGAAKPGLLTPKGVIDAPGVTLSHEEPVTADDYDAVMHLSSDNPEHVLAAEQALWSETTVNSVEFGAPFEGIFTRPQEPPDRRVGFVGHDTVSENLEKRTEFDDTKIPDDAVLSMGFNDLFRNSIPRETNATMLEDQRLVKAKPPGAFAQGSIQHLSKLDINLGSNVGDEDEDGGWYDDHDPEGRRERMFSPEHTEENTGTVGEELGNSNAPGEMPVRDVSADDDLARRVDDHAADDGVVGHVEKISRARFNLNQRLVSEDNGGLPSDDPTRLEVEGDERGEEYDEDLPGHDGTQEAEQVLLRRDFAGVSNEKPGNHFNALMRFNPYMNYIRQAMNGVAFDSKAFGLTGDARVEQDELFDGDLANEDNGIVNYLETQRRANYVVPPITMRALPPAHAARPSIMIGPKPQNPEGQFKVVVGGGTEDYSDLYESNGDASAPGDAPGGEDWLPDSVPKRIDEDSVRFGDHRVVNRGGGATPTGRSYDSSSGKLTLTFSGDEVASAFRDDSIRARLFAKTDERFPVFATVNL